VEKNLGVGLAVSGIKTVRGSKPRKGDLEFCQGIEENRGGAIGRGVNHFYGAATKGEELLGLLHDLRISANLGRTHRDLKKKTHFIEKKFSTGSKEGEG